MTDVHSNPDPSDHDENRLKAAFLARGSRGVWLWFLFLTGAILALTLVANRCGDDDLGTAPTPSAATDPTPTAPATTEPTAVATAVPTATATPEATATPDPTPVPAEPSDVTVTFAEGGGIVLTGTVSSEPRRDELVATAAQLVGADNVDDQLLVDPGRTEDGGIIRVIGSLEEGTGNAALDALNGVVGASTLDTAGLELVASVDVVAQLNDLFRLNPVQFATSSADILPESETVLDEVSTILAQAPALRVQVAGHTDDQGDPTFNETLSLQRAESVVAYLVANGVSDSQLTAIGLGSAQPIADNETDEGRQQNRRIEFTLL